MGIMAGAHHQKAVERVRMEIILIRPISAIGIEGHIRRPVIDPRIAGEQRGIELLRRNQIKKRKKAY